MRQQLDLQSQSCAKSVTLQSINRLDNSETNPSTALLAEAREEVMAEDLLDVLDAASVQYARSFDTFAEWVGLSQLAHKV